MKRGRKYKLSISVMKKQNITSGHTDIKRMREYFEKLYTDKFNN